MKSLDRRLRNLEGGHTGIRAELAAMSYDEIERRLAELEEQTFPLHATGEQCRDVLALYNLPNPLDLETFRALPPDRQIEISRASVIDESGEG